MTMTHSLKCLASAMLITALTAGPCLAGAWTAAKGALYHKATMNFYSADEQFNDSGSKRAMAGHGDFTDTNVSTYLEYGITDTLTVLGTISYKWMESEDDSMTARTEGLSDMEAGLKYRLLSGDFGVVSFQGLVKIPECYDEDDALALGNGQYDVEFRLLYGRSLYPVVPGYFNVEAGYRFRAEEPADEFRYLVELGLDFSSALYGRAKLDGILGMGNDDPSTNSAGNPTATLDYDLGKLDLAFGCRISPRWSFELGYRAEIYGKNTAAGENISLALILSL